MFPDKIFEELKRQKRNAAWLADETKIPPATITKWKEANNCKIDKLIKVCEVLDVSADYLLEIDHRPRTEAPPGSPPGEEAPPMELDPEELMLLEKWNQLDKSGKLLAIDMINGILKQHSKEDKKEKLSNIKIS